MLRILYGGTFDPVHAGHVAVAEAVAACFDADVALLPAADPPHRAPPGASATDRAAMLELAVAGHSRLYVDRRELHRQGPSYSVDTVRDVRAEIGSEAPLAWLLGADAFRGLAEWHRWRELFALAHLIVVARPGHALDALPEELDLAVAERWTDAPAELTQSSAGKVFRLDLARTESATAVRARLVGGEEPDACLLPAVAAWIRKYGLYAGRAG